MPEENTLDCNVFYLAPKSYLESNWSQISTALFGHDTAASSLAFALFLESGGFVYGLRKREETDLLGGGRLNSEARVREYLTDYFQKRNERISKRTGTMRDNEPALMFPSYLQLISIQGVPSKKVRGAILYWKCLFKLALPAYRDSDTRKMIYGSAINAGLEIHVASTGSIVEMRYNFLPFQRVGSEPLFHIVTGDGAIPQIVFLKNADAGVLAPFFLASGAEPFLPATAKSVLPEDAPYKAPIYNATEYDENRVVQWVRPTETTKATSFSDQQSAVTGQKVIRLQPSGTDALTTPCVYWNGTRYDLETLLENTLSSRNDAIAGYTGEAVSAEIQHLLNRHSEATGTDAERRAIEPVVQILNKYAARRFSEEDVQNLAITGANIFGADPYQKAEAVQRFTRLVREIYDPLEEPNNPTSLRHSDVTLVLPLSREWFLSGKDTTLQEEYRDRWSTLGPLNNFGGASGAVVTDNGSLAIIRDALLDLKDIVRRSTKRNSPEAAWLAGLNDDVLS